METPRDVSLVGYDDIAEVRYVRPALTTVRVPKEQVGWTMADLLFRGIDGAAAVPPVPPLRTELVIRETCARPRAAL